MSEFTKGPWEVLSDEHLKANDPKLKLDCLKGFSGEDNILLFGDDCSALGAVYCGHGDKARVNAEADVALISAAPDMYEALEKIKTIAGTIEGKGTLQAADIWNIIDRVQAKAEAKQ